MLANLVIFPFLIIAIRVGVRWCLVTVVLSDTEYLFTWALSLRPLDDVCPPQLGEVQCREDVDLRAIVLFLKELHI